MTAARVKKRDNQQGIALLMVLIALTILGSMTADLLESNETYLATAVNTRDAKQAEYLAKSGINLARLTLSFQDLLGKAANFPFWQYTDMIIPMFTSKDGGFLGDFTGTTFDEDSGMGLKGLPDDADLQVTILDEDSKMNVNIANEPLNGGGAKQILGQLAMLTASQDFDYLFEQESANDELSEREDIICEFVDFSDADEDLCDGSGAEDRSLYTSLDPSYERKNAPLDSLEELHLINGVTDDFYAAFVDPKPEDPNSRIMTVWGKGRINVNTAPPRLLLPAVCNLASDDSGINYCDDLANLQRVMTAVHFAQMMPNMLMMPFSKPSEFFALIENPASNPLLALMGVGNLQGVPIDPVKKSQEGKSFTTSSSVFSIYSTATVGKVTKRIHMVVDTKNETQITLLDQEPVNLAGGKVLYYRME